MSEHTSTRLQISTDFQFENIIVDKTVDTGVYASVSEDDLSENIDKNSTLYSRIRYSSSQLHSPWSNTISFILRYRWKTISSNEPMIFTNDTGGVNPNIQLIKLHDNNVLILWHNNYKIYGYYSRYENNTISISTSVLCSDEDNCRSDYSSIYLSELDRVVLLYKKNTDGLLYTSILIVKNFTITLSSIHKCTQLTTDSFTAFKSDVYNVGVLFTSGDSVWSQYITFKTSGTITILHQISTPIERLAVSAEFHKTVIPLSNDRYLIMYKAISIGSIRSTIVTSVGSSMTIGTQVNTLNTTIVDYIPVLTIDNLVYVCGVQQSSGGARHFAILKMTISGTDIVVGSLTVMQYTFGDCLNLSAISTSIDQILIAYVVSGDTYPCIKYTLLSITNGIYSISDIYELATGSRVYTPILMSTDRIILPYFFEGNGNLVILEG